MKIVNQLLTLLGAMMISSCVDEINLVLDTSSEALVVEARMGLDSVDTYVKVYKTSPYLSGVLNPNYENVPLKSAVIEVKNGSTHLLTQVETGEYRLSKYFEPSEGAEYRLVVESAEGAIFESDWEKMPPKVEIQDLVSAPYEKQIMVSAGQSQFFQIRTFAEIQARIADPAMGDLGYVLETSGISEQFTSSLSDNCACACYLDEPNLFSGMNVVSNNRFQGNTFDLKVGDISLSYLGRFLVKSKLLVVTKNNYEYLHQIDQQQRNTGSIFDPAPSRIKGNIRQRGEGAPTVLGEFILFQESSLEKIFYRSDIRNNSIELNHTLESIPAVDAACTEVYPTATPIAPPAFRP